MPFQHSYCLFTFPPLLQKPVLFNCLLVLVITTTKKDDTDGIEQEPSSDYTNFEFLI